MGARKATGVDSREIVRKAIGLKAVADKTVTNRTVDRATAHRETLEPTLDPDGRQRPHRAQNPHRKGMHREKAALQKAMPPKTLRRKTTHHPAAEIRTRKTFKKSRRRESESDSAVS